MNEEKTRRTNAGDESRVDADRERRPEADTEKRSRPEAERREDKENAGAAIAENNIVESVVIEPAVVKPALPAPPHQQAFASRWRLFCAVELSGEVRARAAEHIALLRNALPDVRAGWERAEKLHITLKFFGDVEQNRTHTLSLALARATGSITPFTLSIAGTGVFPSPKSPRVLWLGVLDASGQLSRLQQSLEDECATEGFARERRSFHPHLTIARLRQPARARQLAALHLETKFPAMEFTVEEVVLMRSELGPVGSRYTALARHPLNLSGVDLRHKEN